MPGKEVPPAPEPSFEAGLTELEQVIKQLEAADLPLERALELFERGMKLSERCRKQLVDAEGRIEILLKKNGRVEAQPFPPKD